MSYVSQTTVYSVYCEYTRYARVSHSRQWSNYNIGSRLRAFDWYQNHRPWITLNGQNTLCCRRDASFGAYYANVNEDRLILSATNDSRFWKVHADIRGVHLGGGLKSSSSLRRSSQHRQHRNEMKSIHKTTM